VTQDQFDAAYRAYCKRRPFRPFFIEFVSGNQLKVTHPEAVFDAEVYYVDRRADSGYEIFAAESVSRLLDVPAPVQAS
jgi:hypothetical protein